MKLPNERWVEIRPCYYALREYTPEQIKMLNTRPTEMIREALRASLAVTSNQCGGGS